MCYVSRVTLDTLRHLLCVTTLHTLETLVMCPVLHVSQLYTPALGVGVSLCVVVCRTVGTIWSQRADVLLRAIQIQPGYSLLAAIHRTVTANCTHIAIGNSIMCPPGKWRNIQESWIRISSHHHELSGRHESLALSNDLISVVKFPGLSIMYFHTVAW